jgi:hypothetical protein
MFQDSLYIWCLILFLLAVDHHGSARGPWEGVGSPSWMLLPSYCSHPWPVGNPSLYKDEQSWWPHPLVHRPPLVLFDWEDSLTTLHVIIWQCWVLWIFCFCLLLFSLSCNMWTLQPSEEVASETFAILAISLPNSILPGTTHTTFHLCSTSSHSQDP